MCRMHAGNCLKVVISCVERFVKFLGHLAYIETAIYGTNFCRSLVKAFMRLIKNVVRFAFVTLFAKLVLTLGKVLVIVASIWCSMLAYLPLGNKNKSLCIERVLKMSYLTVNLPILL